MALIRIDADSPVAPFEQIRTQLAAQVATGQLPRGTKLPTVRALAADLGLAANTVARAYRELEADGLIATHGRRGTFVRSELVELASSGDPDGRAPRAAVDYAQATGDARAAAADYARAAAADYARAAAADYARAARRLGLTLAEATRLLELAWHDPAAPDGRLA